MRNPKLKSIEIVRDFLGTLFHLYWNQLLSLCVVIPVFRSKTALPFNCKTPCDASHNQFQPRQRGFPFYLTNCFQLPQTEQRLRKWE